MSGVGTLYGIGVGPGDPKSLTLRAVEVLGQVDVVLAASSSRNDYSIALSIARTHLRPGVPVEVLKFPMTRDRAELEAAWGENGRAAVAHLRAGRSAAFLTLGDPMLYSTFGYLSRSVEAIDPSLPMEVVPGITSIQAAAARTRTVLAESGESLVILSGVAGEEVLGRMLDRAENVVVMKSYKSFPAIRRLVEDRGAGLESVFASRIGLDGEVVCRDLAKAPDLPHYLSLILLKKKGPADGGGLSD